MQQQPQETSPQHPGVVRLHVNAFYFSTTARRVTSPTWSPPPPCKQALTQSLKKKFRPARMLNPRPLRYQCGALSIATKSQVYESWLFCWFIYSSSPYGFITNQQNDQHPVGLLAQLVDFARQLLVFGATFYIWQPQAIFALLINFWATFVFRVHTMHAD